MASRTQSELPQSAGVDGLLSGYQPTRRARVLCRTVLLLPNFIYRTHRCLLDRYQSGTGTGLFGTHIKEHNSGSVFFKATTYQTLTLNMKWQPNQQLDKLSQIEAKAKIHAACFLDKLHSGLIKIPHLNLMRQSTFFSHRAHTKSNCTSLPVSWYIKLVSFLDISFVMSNSVSRSQDG